MENKETQNMVLKAARAYLKAREYTVKAIQPSEHVDLVAQDPDGDLVFVIVLARKDGCETVRPSREQLEEEAAEYLNSAGINEAHIRFDVISVGICSTERALIKHHVNAYSKGCDLLGVLEELLEAGEITQKAFGILTGAADI